MTQVKRLLQRPPVNELPKIAPDIARTFLNRAYPGLLPRGSHVYRYGSSLPQLTGTTQQWLNLTEDAFDFAEDVLQFCSLLDMTVADHGERNPRTGAPLAGASAIEAWNTGGLRGELEVLADVHVWVGIAAPFAFDRVQGRALGPLTPGTVHLVTAGGANQLLVSRADIPKLRLHGAPKILPRVRLVQ
jgi:hypothetical protein